MIRETNFSGCDLSYQDVFVRVFPPVSTGQVLFPYPHHPRPVSDWFAMKEKKEMGVGRTLRENKSLERAAQRAKASLGRAKKKKRSTTCHPWGSKQAAPKGRRDPQGRAPNQWQFLWHHSPSDVIPFRAGQRGLLFCRGFISLFSRAYRSRYSPDYIFPPLSNNSGASLQIALVALWLVGVGRHFWKHGRHRRAATSASCRIGSRKGKFPPLFSELSLSLQQRNARVKAFVLPVGDRLRWELALFLTPFFFLFYVCCACAAQLHPPFPSPFTPSCFLWSVIRAISLWLIGKRVASRDAGSRADEEI